MDEREKSPRQLGKIDDPPLDPTSSFNFRHDLQTEEIIEVDDDEAQDDTPSPSDAEVLDVDDMENEDILKLYGLAQVMEGVNEGTEEAHISPDQKYQKDEHECYPLSVNESGI